MRLGRVAIALAALVGLSMSGCSTGDPGGPGDEWPAGRTFLSTEVTEGGVARDLVEDTRIAIRFAPGDEVGIDAGCNHMGGKGRLDGGRLILTDLAMTDMACPGGRMEQDAWISQVLTGSPRFELAGDQLTLTGADVVIKLTDRRVIDPDRPLAATTWTVDTIITGTAASSVPQGAEATLEISGSGTFRATTGCAGGLLTGAAGIHSGRIAFSAIEATGCTGAGNALDDAVRATLKGEVAYQIEARRLTLTAPDGRGLSLVAQS